MFSTFLAIEGRGRVLPCTSLTLFLVTRDISTNREEARDCISYDAEGRLCKVVFLAEADCAV